MNYKYHYKITPQDVPNVLQLLKTGVTLQQVGDKYGTSRERIRQIAVKNGLKREDFGSTLRREKEIQDQIQKRLKKYGRAVWRLDSLERIQHELFRRKRQNNKSYRTKEWTIEYNDIEWNKKCPILGIEIDYYAEDRSDNSPSFDRKDPTKGYIKGNVEIISLRANRIKNDGNAEEHFLIYQYLKK